MNSYNNGGSGSYNNGGGSGGFSNGRGSGAGQDLREALNACKPQGYTRIADLLDNLQYPIVHFEKVGTPYGETVMASLEGLSGDDPLRVYMPRRFNTILTDAEIVKYNAGVGPRLHLVKRPAPPGSNNPLLEFV